MSSIIIEKLKHQHQEKVCEIISFINTQSKLWYDKQYTSLNINVDDEVYLHFNQEYQLLGKSLLKVFSQHCSLFKIIEKMRRLVFWLTLLKM